MRPGYRLIKELQRQSQLWFSGHLRHQACFQFRTTSDTAEAEEEQYRFHLKEYLKEYLTKLRTQMRNLGNLWIQWMLWKKM